MKLDSMEKLFVDQIKDLYSAEAQILEALGKMEKAATSEELKKAFSQHRKETEEQIRRLEQVSDELGYSPTGKKCEAAEGLIKEGEDIIEEVEDGEVRDAGLIAAAQRVEHYEIAGYGTARTFARMLGHDKAAEILQKTLDEEAATDQKLTRLAEESINQRAMQSR